MKVIQRYHRAILAPVSIVILLCGCTDLVLSRSPRFAQYPRNDTDFVSTDCERVRPFFESKNITLVLAKESITGNNAKSKRSILLSFIYFDNHVFLIRRVCIWRLMILSRQNYIVGTETELDRIGSNRFDSAEFDSIRVENVAFSL